MTLEDLNYIDRYDGSGEQKTVTFEVPNPNHPECFSVPFGAEPKDEFYEGALWAVNALGSQRNPLVGHFLWAVKQVEVNDNTDPLEELFNKLLQMETHQHNNTESRA